MTHEAHTVEEHLGLRIEIHYDTDPESPRSWDNLGKMECWHRRYDLGDETHHDSYNHRDFLEQLLQNVGVFTELEAKWDRIYEILTATQASSAEIEQYHHSRTRNLQDEVDKHYVILGLSLLDHSGLHMWCGHGSHWSDSAGWDSGPIGWIYCSLQKASENWSVPTWDSPLDNWMYGKEIDASHGFSPMRGRKEIDTRKTVTLREATERALRCEVETYDQYLTGDVHGYIVKKLDPDEDGDDTGDGEHLDSCWGFFGLDCCMEEAKSVAAHYAADLKEEADNEATREVFTQSPTGAD